jgi:hypothetical protein
MSVINQDGEWVHVPGEDVMIEQLKPNVKAWLWKGMNLVDPQRSAALAEYINGDDYKNMKRLFGTELTLTQPEFNHYIEAAQAAENTKEKRSA